MARSMISWWPPKPQAETRTGIIADSISAHTDAAIILRMREGYPIDRASSRRPHVHWRRSSARRRSRGSQRLPGAADLHEVGGPVAGPRVAGRGSGVVPAPGPADPDPPGRRA